MDNYNLYLKEIHIMAYQNKNSFNKKNGGKNFKNNDRDTFKTDKPKRPKKATMTFPIVGLFTSVDRQGNKTEVDYDVVADTLMSLNDNKVFEILTQNVGIARSLVTGDDTKTGTLVVGFINDIFEDETGLNADLTIYGTSVETVKGLMADGDLLLEPKILTYDGQFKCFNGFNLIKTSVQHTEK